MSDPTRTAAPDVLHPTVTIADPAQDTAPPSDAPVPSASHPPSARYVLGEEIARGGMGEVYRATDTVLNREVAVKVLQAKYAPTSAAARRFADEARITGQLQHPAIPPVHDLGTLPDGRPFLAMKLIKGDTLDELLKQRSDPTAERGRFVAVFEAICQAVAYAHAHNVIHRDLKPANVMVGSFGEVQVMDWGLAKVLAPLSPDGRGDGGEGESDDTVPPTEIRSLRDSEDLLTQAGSVLGTPAFMPPEQAIGAVGKVDARSDVFGLGAVLAVILTGQPPFAASSAETTRVKAAQGDVADCLARLDASGADPELVALCKRCLSPKPADRPADAGAVASEVATLRAAADERARQAELDRVLAEAEAREQRKRRKVQLALAAAVGLLLAGGGAFARWQGEQADEQRTADLKRQFENEQKTAVEQARQARNTERIEALLNQCDAALTDDDAEKAVIPLIEAERRAAEGGGGPLAERLARCRADFNLLRELDNLDEPSGDAQGGSEAQRAANNWKTFTRYGLVPGITPVDEAVRRVNGSRVRDRLLGALDDWLYDTRGAESEGDPVARNSVEVAAFLHIVDPDPYRDAVRDAFTRSDGVRLNDLANQPAALEQPARFVPRFFWVSISAERKNQILLASLRRRPNDFRVLKSLGFASMGQPGSETSDTRQWYRAAVAVRPRSAQTHYSLGKTLESESKDLTGAIAEYEEAARLSPGSSILHYSLGNARLRKGDREGAITAFQESFRLDPGGIFGAVVYGELKRLGQKADGERVIAAWQERIRRQPKSSSLQVMFGHCLWNMGDKSGAILAIKEAIRLAPKNAHAHRLLGAYLSLMRDLDGSVAAYREACRLSPKSASSHNDLGAALHDQGKWAEAVAEYKAAVLLEPRSTAYHDDLVRALRSKGDLDGASQEVVRFHQEVVRRESKNAAAHWFLGNALREAGMLDEAEAAYREAIRLDGDKHGSAIDSLADLLRSRGDLSGAVMVYREVLRIDPGHGPSHNWLGWLLATGPDRLRDGKRAVEHGFVACVLSGWKEPNSISNLAAAQAEAGDFTKAVEYQKMALSFPAFEKAHGADARVRLKLFTEKKPYRDVFRPSAPPPRPVK